MTNTNKPTTQPIIVADPDAKPGEIQFHTGENTIMMKPDGSFMLNGKLITTDQKIYKAFKKIADGVGLLSETIVTQNEERQAIASWLEGLGRIATKESKRLPVGSEQQRDADTKQYWYRDVADDIRYNRIGRSG